MNKRAIIVGAGVGGLTTALRLLRNGWTVELFEKEDAPGGRLHRLDEEGYQFDMGPTIILLPDVIRQLFADLNRNIDDYLTLTRIDPHYRYHFADGSTMDASADGEAMATEISRLSRSDVDGYKRYIKALMPRYEIGRASFIEQPMIRARHLLSARQLRNFSRLQTMRTARRDIEGFFSDPRLRDAFSFQSLYVGISPYQAPAIFNVIGFMEQTKSGVWYAKGGFYAVVEALVRLLDEFGGTLHLRHTVTRVLDDGTRATGIQLQDGSIRHADIVVVNADFPQAAKTILPPRSHARFTRTRAERLVQSCSGFMLYLGLDTDYPHAHVHNLHFDHDFHTYMHDVFETGRLPTNPSIYTHFPTRLDPSVAPAGKTAMYVLVPVPNLRVGQVDWQRDAKLFRDQIIQRLSDVGYTDLNDHIVFERMFTPADWSAKFAVADGAAFGVLPTLRQSALWRPSIKSNTLRGLYFVGASTHPGSGVTIVMIGAQTLERVLASDWPGDFPRVAEQ